MPLRLPRFAFSRFEEEVPVSFALPTDKPGTVRRFTLRLAVVQGRDLSSGAGASVAAETCDRLSAIVRPDAWPYPSPPAAGTRLNFPPPRGTYVVKGVTASPRGWRLACVRNMRGEAL